MEPNRQLFWWLTLLSVLFTTLMAIFILFPTPKRAESALPFESKLDEETPNPSTELSCYTATSKLDAAAIEVLNSSNSFEELTAWAQSNPTEMSSVLPQLVSQLYGQSDGNTSTFEAVLRFVQGLPTIENQVAGLSALWDEFNSHSPFPEVHQLLKLAENVEHLTETTTSLKASVDPLGPCEGSKLANLTHDLAALILIGERSDCKIINVAYQKQLLTNDHGSPEAAYLDGGAVPKWRIAPSVATGKLTFRIQESADILYASDGNPNKDRRNGVYQTRASERYVLLSNPVPAEGGEDWELVAVGGGKKNKEAHLFEIKVAETSDVMFAHRSARGGINGNLRRVLLRKSGYNENYQHVFGDDWWKLDCTR